ncbi:ABC transporter permease [Alkaliphilus peptidifermentans]|uniref:ABC-2 type transport system permease protein n=1 Tax=Alkaliphilus peptidifermentans DSM 18978 TaxID=1120976 RepID=A0A1G5KB39_9FIRM|nr:ABC transporter permease [Alkaliphilus peptidifermentans]SCY97260.1 ABC-2 type transport system permease protein [Alkaliphilus peptidifermentans DSM 18978]
MKRIMFLFRKDVKSAFRDNLITYIMIAPIILSFILIMVMPVMDGTGLTFAIDNTVSEDFAVELQQYGKVERFSSINDLEKRVLLPDDVPGITFDSSYRILLEGNESEELIQLVGMVVDRVAHGESLINIKIDSMMIQESSIREYSAIIMILTSILLAGVIMGFNIIDEKETRAIHAISVSPVKMMDYVIGRGLIGIIFSLILGLLTSIIIMGFNLDWLMLIVVILVSSLLGILVGFFLGFLANNQVSGIAIMKVTMVPIVFTIIASFFTPDKWQWLYYPLPNYWTFQLVSDVIFRSYDSFKINLIMTFALNFGLLLIFFPLMKRKFRLR